MYYIRTVTFVEQPLFTRLLVELVDDDAYRKFQNELAANPEKGPVVKGSGGLRKVRMALPGRGKSGGARGDRPELSRRRRRPLVGSERQRRRSLRAGPAHPRGANLTLRVLG